MTGLLHVVGQPPHKGEPMYKEALAQQYAKSPSGQEQKHPMDPKTAEHCKYYAEHCRKAAEAARQIAASHTAMAKQNLK